MSTMNLSFHKGLKKDFLSVILLCLEITPKRRECKVLIAFLEQEEENTKHKTWMVFIPFYFLQLEKQNTI